MPSIDIDEVLMYLHRQIDPHDSHNPKYQALWRQIEHIRRARADYLAASVPPLIIARGKLEPSPVTQPCDGEGK